MLNWPFQIPKHYIAQAQFDYTPMLITKVVYQHVAVL